MNINFYKLQKEIHSQWVEVTSIFLCCAGCAISTSAYSDTITGFEDVALWSASPTSTVLSLSADHVEGASALSVNNISGYVALLSSPAAAPFPVGATASLRIKPPSSAQGWAGQVQLFVSSPSRGIYSQIAGTAALDGLSPGVFGTVVFNLPAGLVSAISNGSTNDMSYMLALNTPFSGPYLLDNLQFGATALDSTLTPTPLAYTGGEDVALVWKPITWSRTTLRYQVYRDDQLIGIADPTLYRNGESSASYIDSDVADGQTYRYSVQAVASEGTLATRSSPVTITHSQTGVQVPSITIVNNGYTYMNNYLESGAEFLKTWYPKIANMIAYDEYEVPGSIIIEAALSCPGPGWTYPDQTPAKIFICAAHDYAASDDVGLFVHESTHLIQAYSGYQLAAAGESIATWAGNLAIGRANVKPKPMFSFYDDYEYGAYFFDWIAETYDRPDFIRDLNLKIHRGEYTDAWLSTYTGGYTLGQLFGAMMGTGFTSPGSLKNVGGSFAFPADSGLSVGSRILLRQDPESNASRFFQGPIENGMGPLRWEKNVCLGEDADHYVVVQNCYAATPTQWIYEAQFNQFKSAASGRCLQSLNGSSADETPLVTALCSSSVAQKWDPLPL